MTRPTVTVVVPTYNRSAMLREAIESLHAQSVRPVQVLIVDDCSSDDTPEVVAAYGDRVDYLRTPAQAGKSAALNVALERVVGDVLWILDDDDAAYPDAVERIGAALAANPVAAFAFGTQDNARSTPEGRLDKPYETVQMPAVNGLAVFSRLLDDCFLGGAKIAVRTTHARSCGGFDPRFIRSQDYDYALRVCRHVCGVRIEGGSLYIARQHEGVRGTAAIPIGPKERGRRWLEYDQMIFRALHASLELAEYVAPLDVPSFSERSLLLRRASVMSRRGLYDLAVDDVAAALARDDHTALSASERTALGAILFDNQAFTGEALVHANEAWRSARRVLASSPQGRRAAGRLARERSVEWLTKTLRGSPPGGQRATLQLAVLAFLGVRAM